MFRRTLSLSTRATAAAPAGVTASDRGRGMPSREVTRAAGYQFFVFDTRNTRANTTYQAVPSMPPPDPWWGWRRGFGYWGGYGWAYDPGVDVITRTNYQAYAEIVLLTPEQAQRETRAIRAEDVIAHIGPDAVTPPPAGSAPPPPPPR